MNDDAHSEPNAGLSHLTPPPGGFERLLARRERRYAVGRRIEAWAPAAALAASVAMLSILLRGPTIDVSEVRRQLQAQGTTLQLVGEQHVVIEQRTSTDGMHMYVVSKAP